MSIQSTITAPKLNHKLFVTTPVAKLHILVDTINTQTMPLIKLVKETPETEESGKQMFHIGLSIYLNKSRN